MTPEDGEIVWDDPEAAPRPSAEMRAPAHGSPDTSKRQYAWGDPTLPIDPKGRLLTPVPCRACNTNLIGRKLKAECPECGRPVAWSARGNRLAYADADWVDGLRSGVGILLLGVLVSFALLVVAVSVSVVMQASSGADPARAGRSGRTPTFEEAMQQSMGPPEAVAVTAVAGLIGSVVMLLGIWRLTEPEPGGSLDAEAVNREVLRWSWLSSAVLSVSGNVLALVDVSLAMLVSFANVAFSVVAMVALLAYLGRIARRLPDDDLAGKTKLLVVLILLCVGVSAIGMWMILTTATKAGPSGLGSSDAATLQLGFIVMFATGVVWVVLAIGWLLLLNTYRNRLAEAYLKAVRTKTVRY